MVMFEISDATSDGKCLEMLFSGSDKCNEVSRVNGKDSNEVSILGLSVIYGYGISTTAMLAVSKYSQVYCNDLSCSARDDQQEVGGRSQGSHFYTKTHFTDTLSVCLSYFNFLPQFSLEVYAKMCNFRIHSLILSQKKIVPHAYLL